MTEELEAEEIIGKDMKSFLVSPSGKYIDGCTQQDIDLAKDELLELDPYKSTTLQELQNKVIAIQTKARIAIALRSYIAEAIVKGNQATHQLNQEGQD